MSEGLVNREEDVRTPSTKPIEWTILYNRFRKAMSLVKLFRRLSLDVPNLQIRRNFLFESYLSIKSCYNARLLLANFLT